MSEDKSNRLQIFLIIFNCKKDVKTYEEITKLKLQPIKNFVEIIENRFEKLFIKNGRHLSIMAPNYKIYCGTETIKTIDREVDIYGEDGLHEFIALAKEHDWKLYDKHLDSFIDLDFPKKYSYKELQIK